MKEEKAIGPNTEMLKRMLWFNNHKLFIPLYLHIISPFFGDENRYKSLVLETKTVLAFIQTTISGMSQDAQQESLRKLKDVIADKPQLDILYKAAVSIDSKKT